MGFSPSCCLVSRFEFAQFERAHGWRNSPLGFSNSRTQMIFAFSPRYPLSFGWSLSFSFLCGPLSWLGLSSQGGLTIDHYQVLIATSYIQLLNLQPALPGPAHDLTLRYLTSQINLTRRCIFFSLSAHNAVVTCSVFAPNPDLIIDQMNSCSAEDSSSLAFSGDLMSSKKVSWPLFRVQ